jgi:hypothetical protein
MVDSEAMSMGNANKSAGTSIFTRHFDVGVFGAGYAGFAAAMHLAESGKSVFLADLRGDLLWESGRAFQMATGPWTPGFRLLSNCLARITGVTSEWFDGGTSEVVATELLRDARLPALYYVAPVGVMREGDQLRAVVVVTKGGLRRLEATQWIDATENGSIVQLLDPARCPRSPARLLAHVMLQRMRWPEEPSCALDIPDGLPDCHLEWKPTPYCSERTLTIDMPGDESRFLRTVSPALRMLRKRLGDEFDDAFVSHLSFTPYPLYDAAQGTESPASNLSLAVPGLAGSPVRTLTERFELGLAAARELADRQMGKSGAKQLSGTIPMPLVFHEETAAIAVAGLGTGGVMAAIAAARAGADVLAFDMASFAGGIGVGAGIPGYYYGCPGGLQDEVDNRVRELMPLFASRAVWERGFHPDVKRIVVDDLLHSAGVRILFGAMAGMVERDGRRITAAVAATQDGPVRIRANAWIDASGDGDLAAMAGARFHLGRKGDGGLHAYTQSCGSFCCVRDRLVNNTTNPDSGFTDPTDAEEMTRARIEGIHALNMTVVNAMNRLTYVAPLIGIRQGRRIESDYMLTLDDLVERRRFPDAVGYTGCHYDNHASDYEQESDEAFFYVACAGLVSARTACEIPYRMLLPKGLANVWLACRAAGVTEEACHSFRMQRDVQRIGEVCGLAAALAANSGGDSRAVPYGALRVYLERSDAVPLVEPGSTDFGKAVGPGDFAVPVPALPVKVRIARNIEALKTHGAGLALWQLYKAGPRKAGATVLPCLDSRDATRSWQAAMLFAMWGDPAAEPRLLRAIRHRETGVEHDPSAFDPRRGSKRILPRWWAAVTLLRRCGTLKAIPTLQRLASSADLPFRIRTAMVITITRISERCHPAAAPYRRVRRLVDALAQIPTPVSVDNGGAFGWQLSDAAARAYSVLDKAEGQP